MNTLESLVEDEIKLMPDPSPNVDKIIGADEPGIGGDEKPSENANVKSPDFVMPDTGQYQQAGTRDKAGVLFDPEIHATDSNGNPSITKNGNFRKKPGRKASGQTGESKDNSINASREAGRATAETIFALCVGVMGEEWQPIYNPKEGVNERQQMVDAWAAYYQATGKTDMPPWVVVAIACSCYSLPRLSMPKTQSRMERFLGRIKSWYSDRKNNKKKGAGNGA